MDVEKTETFKIYNIFITFVRFGGISHEQSASNFRS